MPFGRGLRWPEFAGPHIQDEGRPFVAAKAEDWALVHEFAVTHGYTPVGQFGDLDAGSVDSAPRAPPPAQPRHSAAAGRVRRPDCFQMRSRQLALVLLCLRIRLNGQVTSVCLIMQIW
jgi:hypothetical protein